MKIEFDRARTLRTNEGEGEGEGEGWTEIRETCAEGKKDYPGQGDERQLSKKSNGKTVASSTTLCFSEMQFAHLHVTKADCFPPILCLCDRNGIKL